MSKRASHQFELTTLNSEAWRLFYWVEARLLRRTVTDKSADNCTYQLIYHSKGIIQVMRALYQQLLLKVWQQRGTKVINQVGLSLFLQKTPMLSGFISNTYRRIILSLSVNENTSAQVLLRHLAFNSYLKTAWTKIGGVCFVLGLYKTCFTYMFYFI